MALRQFFNKLFFKKNENFILKIFLFPLQVISYFYLLLISIKNFMYNNKIFKQIKFKSFVISVGNITVGGSGKTPTVIAIAEYLKKRNYRVGIIARIYNLRSSERAKGGFVENSDPEIFGDEPALIKTRLDNIILYAGTNKSKLAVEMEKVHSPEIIIIDDGFSHRRIARDYDIVMVDAENPFGNRFLLPRGPLREPLSSLKRADAVLIKSINELKSDIDTFNNIPTYNCVLRLLSIRRISDDELIQGLEAERFIAFSGIGNSESFRKTLLFYKLKPLDFIEFEDHMNYDRDDVNYIEKSATKMNAGYCVCTEKDAVKLKKIIKDMKTRSTFCYVSVEMEIEKRFFEDLEEKIQRWYRERT